MPLFSILSSAPRPASARALPDLRNPWTMRWFTLLRLPSLAFWGVRVLALDAEQAQTVIRYGWRTQNPFRSLYFAALAGAAELSTGVLGLAIIQQQGQSVSMLITGVEGQFLKKATGRIVFTCQQGQAMAAVVERAIATGEPQTFQALSTGIQENTGQEVARFAFTWSFKAR